MATTLTLKREGFGIELRRGRFDAMIDGNRVASLDWHETVEVPIEPGHPHAADPRGPLLQPAALVRRGSGETVTFQLHGANLWPIYVASFVKPDLGISLKRVDGQR